MQICLLRARFQKKVFSRIYKATIIGNIKMKSQLISIHSSLYVLYIHITIHTHYTFIPLVHSSVLFKQRHALETHVAFQGCIMTLYLSVSLHWSRLGIHKVVISCRQGNQTESIQPTGLVREEPWTKNDKECFHLALTREACLIGSAWYEFVSPLWGTHST